MGDTIITLEQLGERVSRGFQDVYGRVPRWLVAAPGRVNIIGEHTDYNDGFVLPMAIERYTVLAADRGEGDRGVGQRRVSWCSGDLKETAVVRLEDPVPIGEPGWSNYVRGVLAGFQERGWDLGSLDVYAESTVPIGGGLSSSAALEVATATLLETIDGRKLDPVEKALLCQKAEHDYAGMPCGIMDQFISVMGQKGHLLLLDCRSRKTELVPMADPELAVLIVNTNVRHELTGGEYAQRRAQCEEAARILGVPALRDADPEMLSEARDRMDPVVFRRAKHVISEIERTLHTAASFRASNWPTVGQLMYASHHSLRDDYEVSCSELNLVVDIGQSIGLSGGVIGCRMTGGGFGGCAVCLVRKAALPDISARIQQEYLARTEIRPSLFVSQPAAGARVLQAGNTVHAA